jgi:hypothetical protein
MGKVYDPKPGYKSSSKVRKVDTHPAEARCYEKEYWDGHQDARVYPKPVRMKVSLREVMSE